MVNVAFSCFPRVSVKVVDWVSPSSTGDSLCSSDWIVLLFTSLSSRFVSDLDGSEAISWLT